MKRSALALVFAVFAATPAHATITVFTDPDLWAAAAGSFVQEDFDATPVGPLAPGTTDIGAFSIFLDKNTDNRNDIASSPNFFRGYIDNGANPIDVGALDLRFLFDQPLIGFGASWSSTTNADLVRIIVDGFTIRFEDFLTTGTGEGFLGFVSTNPFSQFSFAVGNGSSTVDGEAFGMDRARLATGATDVPEPGTAALLLGAAAAFWGGRRVRS